MFGDLHARPGVSIRNVLNTVECTGEPTVFLSLAHIGDVETLFTEVRTRGLRMAGFPKDGLTLLPRIPVTEDELHSVCETYCRAPTQAARAALRQSLYLREYPHFPPGTTDVRPFYHPADVVIKLAELCLHVVKATPAELSEMMGQTPYLHVAQIRVMFESIKLSMSSGGNNVSSFGDFAASVRQGQQHLTGFRDPFGSTPDHSKPVELPVTHPSPTVTVDVRPNQLFSKDTLESEGGPDTPLDDLTGQETVDQVKKGNTEYLKEEDFELVSRSSVFYYGEGDAKRLAAVYITGALSPEKCRLAANVLEPAATRKNLRMLTNGGEPPETGIVGYYDYLNNPTQHKCRETSFMRSHFTEVMQGCASLLKDIDDVYQKCAPLHYNLQQIAIPTQFQLFKTVFSTVTVNRNFRTAVHTDSGDFRSGLGALAVIDGHFKGCHLAIKKLGKAFRLQVGDVILFDTSLEHGNTEVHDPDGAWKRVSLVCYLRNGLMSAVCELERRKHLNRLIAESLESIAESGSAVNINSVDDALPPLYVPVRLAGKLGVTQMSALTFVSERAQKGSGCVLAMAMGLGKTLVALTLCYSYLHQYPHRDILVLVPKPIIRHWVSEYEKWSSYGLHFDCLVASDDQNTRAFEESLYRYQQQLSGFAPRSGHVFIINPEYIGSLLRRFKKFDPILIIADEGHRVASKGSKLTAVLSRLTCPLRVVLSGTPLQNNADELYRLVGWVNRGVYAVVPPRIFSELAADINRYIKGDDDAFADAVLAQQYIQDWMKGFVFREMESDLPPLYDYLLLCGSSATQRRIEDSIGLSRDVQGSYVMSGANDHRVCHLSTHPLCYWAFITGGYHSLIKSTSGGGPEEEPLQRVRLTVTDLEEVKKCYAMVQNGELDVFAALSGKLTVLVKIVQEVRARGEKLIIFSQYIGTQDLIHRALTAFRVPVFTVRGRDSQERRKFAMEQFASDSKLVALILSTKIAAYGLDFTAANHVILFDSWWNPQVDAQAIARAYRRNQTKPVTVYRLAGEIEDRSILSVQTRKIALFNCIMHEKTSRSALPEEVEDCADSEENEVRRELWSSLKAHLLEGGFPALRNVCRYTDNVKETDSLVSPAAAQIRAKRPREE